MFFSVIVPVYNVVKYLPQCLLSVKKQSFSDFEVIIVDDGSTDGCSRVCDEFAEKDDRFRVIHKKNKGLVSARKTAVEVATGEYVINIDSDDYIDDDMFLIMYKYLVKRPVDVLAFGYRAVDSFGNTKSIHINDIKKGLYIDDDLDKLKNKYLHDNDKKGNNHGCLIYSIWTKIVKTELIRQCQLQVDDRIRIGEDVAVGIRFILKADSVLICEDTPYYYRVHSQSMSLKLYGHEVVHFSILASDLNNYIKNHYPLQNQVNAYINMTSLYILKNFSRKGVGFNDFKCICISLVDRGLFNHKDYRELVDNSIKGRLLCFLVKHHIWWAVYICVRIKASLNSY